MGPYVLRICFLLGIVAASLYLALVYSASSCWITAVQRGNRGLKLFRSSSWFLFTFHQTGSQPNHTDVHWGVPRFSKLANHVQRERGALPGSMEKMWWEGATMHVKTGILRGWGLIRLGRVVPMVITMVTQGLSQEVAAEEVEWLWVREMKHGRSLRQGGIWWTQWCHKLYRQLILLPMWRASSVLMSTSHDLRLVATEAYGVYFIYKKQNEVSFYEEPQWWITVAGGARAP